VMRNKWCKKQKKGWDEQMKECNEKMNACEDQKTYYDGQMKGCEEQMMDAMHKWWMRWTNEGVQREN
jgi:chromosome segregation ATPase